MPPSAMGCTSPLLKQQQDSGPAPAQEAPADKKNPDPARRIKCVLVGDGAVGKTSLVVSYSTNGFPSEYVPTAFDNYNVLVRVDGRPYSVQLCDTAGQDALDPLRALCYPDADVFLVVFSVVAPATLRSVERRWAPEVRRHCPDAPLVLVGAQADRRRDARLLATLAAAGQAPVSAARAAQAARTIGAASYVETSALTQRDLKEAFDQAIVCALRRRGLLRPATPPKPRQRPLWRRLCCCTRGGGGAGGGSGSGESAGAGGGVDAGGGGGE
ncbi:cell division control protein 42 homolog [Schistocerca serialis cubense]|uniref:cell division control protein 42 homolog n=1 Tax=Schistocerca serialis cubense TaxID=2023355 RepID=UPI00214F4235|nr:cell division control protein 42 homolog [Schistocerca serialis cubense]